MGFEWDWKKFGLSVLLGTGVVILTPLLAGLVSGVAFLQTAVLGVSIATILAAGIVAMVLDYVLSMWLGK